MYFFHEIEPGKRRRRKEAERETPRQLSLLYPETDLVRPGIRTRVVGVKQAEEALHVLRIGKTQGLTEFCTGEARRARSVRVTTYWTRRTPERTVESDVAAAVVVELGELLQELVQVLLAHSRVLTSHIRKG
jgi:hypothetical protein